MKDLLFVRLCCLGRWAPRGKTTSLRSTAWALMDRRCSLGRSCRARLEVSPSGKAACLLKGGAAKLLGVRPLVWEQALQLCLT